MTVENKHLLQRRCPLCHSQNIELFHRDEKRDFLNCNHCGLIFVPKQFHLNASEEKLIYDQHENNPADFGYRHFLSRLAKPLNDRIGANSYGLDFGSGPGPTLSVMLSELGHNMDIYDPFYAPEQKYLHKDYDFITATEVFEHLSQPRREIQSLWSCLKLGGFLAVMTKLWTGQGRFAQWHYKNDPTHIAFYRPESFHYIANQWCAEIEILSEEVVILQRNSQ